MTNTKYDPLKQWGPDASRGARTVYNRIVKEGANVPLFLAQTVMNAMRDVGYNDTITAICELIDNSIQSDAKSVRIYFNQTGRRGAYQIDVLVIDDGEGMPPNVLQTSVAFGGSTAFNSREKISKYGMGMNCSALSMAPAFDVVSWQEPGAFYRMVLDTQAIADDRANLVTLPEPVPLDAFPDEITQILTHPMVYPKSSDDQELLTADREELAEALGAHGTAVFMADCDRLTYRTAKTLVDHATRAFGRVYRRFIEEGLEIYVNNRLVEATDPTFASADARHARVPEIEGKEKTSRLINRWEIPVPLTDDSRERRVAEVVVRLYRLPIEEWGDLPAKVRKNDLRIFDGHIISYMRGDREIHSTQTAAFTGRYHTAMQWVRVEVEFPGTLDEAFGISFNKQGVRPQAYVNDLIKKEIREELRRTLESIKRYWSERAKEAAKGEQMSAEQRANDAEPFMGTVLKRPDPKTDEERAQLEQALRDLSLRLRRRDETDEEAYARVSSSTYITDFKHDADATFYRVDTQLGKVILTLNTAHAFYQHVYQPLATLSSATSRAEATDDGSEVVDPAALEASAKSLEGLHIMLLALARTQAALLYNDEEQLAKTFNLMRRQWSLNLETQLTS